MQAPRAAGDNGVTGDAGDMGDTGDARDLETLEMLETWKQGEASWDESRATGLSVLLFLLL